MLLNKLNRKAVWKISVILISLLFPVYATSQEDGRQFTSFSKFNLNVGTLEDVQSVLGPSTLVETGEAGEYEASVCYRLPGGLVYFLSGGMGGRDLTLLGFGISKLDARKPCAHWPRSVVAPILQIGKLRVGMTVDAFSKIVNGKIEWDGNNARFFYETKRKFTQEEMSSFNADVQTSIKDGGQQNYFDVQVALVAKFRNKRLTEVRVWKIKTL
ncbi:hypothetical protein AAKU67_000923 [Oxalobacteraceae bacterium GrIS 2.11]